MEHMSERKMKCWLRATLLWCDGAPGSRLDPRRFGRQAFEAGYDD